MVPVEHHIFPDSFRTLTTLYKLAPSRTRPQTLQEANQATSGIRPVVLAHDRFDSLAGLVGVVERDGGDVVMKDMGFDDAMEEVAADETEVAVDC